jgi:hypothetical protein
MGTNYYVATNYCDHCKQYKEDLHIGKSSYGWCFYFQGYKHSNITSWKEWQEYLKDKLIVDEYGEITPYDDFVSMVQIDKHPKSLSSRFHHNEEGRKKGWFHPEYDWDDEEGFPFSDRWFS